MAMIKGPTAADELVARAAVTVTRRRFLRNAGTAALGVALSTALVGTQFFGNARANTVHRPSNPCGPSPKCNSSNCTNDGQCRDGLDHNCRCRPYAAGTCEPCPVGSFPSGQCWVENYCGSGNGRWRCCDCCCPNATGDPCTSCSSPRQKCICRIRLAC